MLYFLDCEASSLSENSHPIEIAWLDENGQGESYLINPAPGWDDWSAESEAIHKISREKLYLDGVAYHSVARRAQKVLCAPNAIVCADNPYWDRKWMSVLLSTIGVTDVPNILGPREASIPILSGLSDRAVLSILANAENKEALTPRTHHRALSDAESVWRTWKLIKDQAEKAQKSK